jgi:hypothetical protein
MRFRILAAVAALLLAGPAAGQIGDDLTKTGGVATMGGAGGVQVYYTMRDGMTPVFYVAGGTGGETWLSLDLELSVHSPNPAQDDVARAAAAGDSTGAKTQLHYFATDLDWVCATGDAVDWWLREKDDTGTGILIASGSWTLDAPGTLIRELLINDQTGAWNDDASTRGEVCAAADTATYFDRNTYLGGDQYAACRIMKNNPTVQLSPETAITVDGYATPITAVGARHSYHYMDLSAATIPDGVRVAKAWLIVNVDDSSNMNWVADKKCMLNYYAGDSGWVDAPAQSGGSEFSRQVTWNELDDDANTEWALTDRDSLHAWNFLGHHSPTVHTAAVLGGDGITWDVTEAVQTYVDFRDLTGIDNAGFIPYSTYNGSWSFSGVSNASDRNDATMLIVWYTTDTLNHTAPWGGEAPIPFLFFQDDVLQTEALAWMTQFDAAGMVMNFAGATTAHVGGTGYMTDANVRTAISRGHGFTKHGERHDLNLHLHGTSWGIGDCSWPQTWGAPWSTGCDTAVTEVTRNSARANEIFQIADGDSADDYIDSFAYPNGGVSMAAYRALVACDVGWARAAGGNEERMGPDNGDGSPNPAVYPHPGYKTWLNWYGTTNRYAVAVNSSLAIFHSSSHNPNSDTIKHNLRGLAGLAMENGLAAMMTLVHDTKVNTDYPNGADYDEVGWMLTHLEDLGVFKTMTANEMWDAYEPWHEFIDPTAALGVIDAGGSYSSTDSLYAGEDGTVGTSDDQTWLKKLYMQHKNDQ